MSLSNFNKCLLIGLTMFGCGHLGYSYADALTALQIAYRTEGQACLVATKTPEAAGECLAHVKDKYAPIWAGAETAEGFCDIITSIPKISSVASEYCRGVHGAPMNLGRHVD